MCGRFTLTAPASQLQTRFACTIPGPPPAPRYNIAPAQPVLAVLPGGDGRRTGAMLRWGLIPPWAKDARIGSRMINAVSETAPDKPAFRDAFRRRRCLVLADGFYEWQHRAGSASPYTSAKNPASRWLLPDYGKAGSRPAANPSYPAPYSPPPPTR